MYVDKSEDEFSVHMLSKEDLQLIYDAVIIYYNHFPFPAGEEDRDAKKRLVKIKTTLENEVPVN